MWKILKILGYLLKSLFWLICILLLLGLASLYLLERDAPEFILKRVEQAASTDDYFVRVERATFSLKRGIRLRRVKLLPKRIASGALISADEVNVVLSLSPFTPLEQRLRSLSIKNFSMPDLPPKNKEEKEDHPPFTFTQELAPFEVHIEQADLIGIKADTLTTTISTANERVFIKDLSIKLPHPQSDLSITGDITIDLKKSEAHGKAHGIVFPENIMPLFKVLKARGAIEQINCFSHLERPVKVDYIFDVDFTTTDFAMHLDLDVGSTLYRSVPISYIKGDLGIYGTNIYTTVHINNIDARTVDNAPIKANLIYCDKTESLKVDGDTTMHIKPLFNMINILNQGELDRVKCVSPPTLSAVGEVALSAQKSTIPNNLSGKVAIPEGTILNFAVRNTTADFKMEGYQCRFIDAHAQTPAGGSVNGAITFDFPDYQATATVFQTAFQLKDVALEEISHAFNVTNSRAGLVTGRLALNGPVSDETIHFLNGTGKLDIRDGVINQMRLFAGFTDYLSRNIPGVSSLVNQSAGSLDFTITNGVLRTDNLILEGSVFSINGHGSYNMVTDKLEFTVRASIFKRRTWLGKITNLITLPFTRLLLEFKVFGSLENPDWSYVNIIEKISDAFNSENSEK